MDVNMDIGVSGFGPESAIDTAMVMVSVASKWLFEDCHFYCFIKETLFFIKNKINLGGKKDDMPLRIKSSLYRQS